MSDRDGKPFRKPVVIIRPGRTGVFSELVTPNGGSVKVMSREVFAKANRAAGIELEKVSRKSSAGSKLIIGKPWTRVR